MPTTVQEYLADATEKAATHLVTALLNLPEDKRRWSPAESARTALDQVAECALLNGYTAELIRTRQWSTSNFDAYQEEKDRIVAGEWSDLQALLTTNTQKVIDAIRATPDDVLAVEIQMPWSTQTMAEMLAYPYWNMSYHGGQINYIASILGCLK